jgi:hypothetical protein
MPPAQTPTPTEHLLLSVRPVFVGWVALATLLPYLLFFPVWAAIFFGSIIAQLGGLSSTCRPDFFGARLSRIPCGSGPGIRRKEAELRAHRVNNVARLNSPHPPRRPSPHRTAQPAMGWTDTDQLICRLSIYCIKLSKDFFVNFEYRPPP